MKVAVCRPLMPCHLGKRQAASPPRTPQPPRLPHPAVSRGVPPGRPAELAGRPRPNRPAQSQGPPAVTSESRPLRRRTPSRQAARGPVYPLKVTRGFMPLYLSGFLRDSTRRGRPGSSGAKTPTWTWIRPRPLPDALDSGFHCARTPWAQWVVATVPVDDPFRVHLMRAGPAGCRARAGQAPWAWPLMPAARGRRGLRGPGRPAGPSPQAMRSSLEAGGAAPDTARRPPGK